MLNKDYAKQRVISTAVEIKTYINEDKLSLENNIWQAYNLSALSYPEEERDAIFDLEERSFWFLHRSRCIAEAIRRLPPDGPVFDVGGGNGFFSNEIQMIGFNPVLVEPGMGGVRNAQRRGYSFPIICSEFSTQNFKMNSIPAVALFDVIEHMRDDAAFLSEVNNLMRRNAYLYITVPASMRLWSSADEEGGHFRRYDDKSLQTLLSNCGFVTRYSTYFLGYLPIPIYFARVLPDKFGIRANYMAKAEREHTPWGIVSLLLKAPACIEAAIIKNGWRIPFGGSILTVAQKQ